LVRVNVSNAGYDLGVRVNVGNASMVGGRERREEGIPTIPTRVPWWPYYTGIYGPAILPGWTTSNLPLTEESVPSPRVCSLHSDKALGSVW